MSVQLAILNVSLIAHGNLPKTRKSVPVKVGVPVVVPVPIMSVRRCLHLQELLLLWHIQLLRLLQPPLYRLILQFWFSILTLVNRSLPMRLVKSSMVGLIFSLPMALRPKSTTAVLLYGMVNFIFLVGKKRRTKFQHWMGALWSVWGPWASIITGVRVQQFMTRRFSCALATKVDNTKNVVKLQDQPVCFSTSKKATTNTFDHQSPQAKVNKLKCIVNKTFRYYNGFGQL